ncbi:MAG: amidase [Gammaproteobacteria bacterium]|nr:amidase [Gammaproteobacteria bacterium]
MTGELNQFGLNRIVRHIRDGRASCAEVAEAFVSRIRARESTVGAFESFDEEEVLESARRLDGMPDAGPLRGAPIGVKDVIDMRGHTAAWGSPIYRGRMPHGDASCVALCRAAGGNLFGKTVTTEFAYFSPGRTVNPHNPEHTPGGSSMGSAAAVADGMLPFAFGTQTAASVTRPAAYCGVIGYKASWGSFDLQGICGLAPSLDTLGFFCREIEDIPLMRSVLCGDRADLKLRGDGDGPRVAFVKTPHWEQADDATRNLLTKAADSLADLTPTEEVKLPPGFGDLADCHNGIMAFEAARARAYEYLAHADLLSPQFRELMEMGRAVTHHAYRGLKGQAAEAMNQLATLFDRHDVLLAPSATGEAPLGLGSTGNPIFSRMWTLLKVPSVTLPAGRGPAGLPLGIQLIGRLDEDNALLRDAQWIQAALNLN